ncbi:YCF48-related protein [Azoarcus sp. PA01]|nr:YCF48-related protein [Azoarcus sp. PA01]
MSEPVPDLMEVAASADVRATSSVQLAVTHAGERLVSVGVRGTVLLSDDCGNSWRQAKTVPSSVALTAVTFVTDQLGWAVGHSGVVLHSRDGGETWVRQLDGRQAAQRVFEEAKARAAAGEDGADRLLRDAQRIVEDGPDKPLLGVSFANERRGYVVGAYGLALATDDGGQSWHAIQSRVPNPRGLHLYTVHADGDQLLISGEQGAFFGSADAGASFSAIKTPYAGTFFGVLALGDETLLAYGLRGNVWRSSDAGASWTHIALDQDITITSAVRLKDGSVVLADESGRLRRSNDRGRSFTALEVKAPNAITALAQAGDGALIMAGARGLNRVGLAQFIVAERK